MTGESVRLQWFEKNGVTIEASTSTGANHQVHIFDTSNPGAIHALGSPNEHCPTPGSGIGAPGAQGMPHSNCISQGNVLIIKDLHENDSGAITLTFAFPSKVGHVTLLDIQDEGSVINITQKDGTMTTLPYRARGPNSIQKIPIDLFDVVKLEVHFFKAGALVDVGICFHCSETTGCLPIETKFKEVCSMGQFSEPDFVPFSIIESNWDEVTFTVKHKPSFASLSNIEMWYLNPDQDESRHFCWVYSNGKGQPANSCYELSTGNDRFTAKCVGGSTKISITAGGGSSNFHRDIEVNEPYCQKNQNPFGDEPLQYNSLKRCYWEFTLPCDCTSSLAVGERLLQSRDRRLRGRI